MSQENLIKLQCSDPECKSINYFSGKSKGNKDKLGLKKYCRKCRKHTLHKEMKK